MTVKCYLFELLFCWVLAVSIVPNAATAHSKDLRILHHSDTIILVNIKAPFPSVQKYKDREPFKIQHANKKKKRIELFNY